VVQKGRFDSVDPVVKPFTVHIPLAQHKSLAQHGPLAQELNSWASIKRTG